MLYKYIQPFGKGENNGNDDVFNDNGNNNNNNNNNNTIAIAIAIRVTSEMYNTIGITYTTKIKVNIKILFHFF